MLNLKHFKNKIYTQKNNFISENSYCISQSLTSIKISHFKKANFNSQNHVVTELTVESNSNFTAASSLAFT